MTDERTHRVDHQRGPQTSSSAPSTRPRAYESVRVAEVGLSQLEAHRLRRRLRASGIRASVATMTDQSGGPHRYVGAAGQVLWPAAAGAAIGFIYGIYDWSDPLGSGVSAAARGAMAVGGLSIVAMVIRRLVRRRPDAVSLERRRRYAVVVPANLADEVRARLQHPSFEVSKPTPRRRNQGVAGDGSAAGG